MTTKLERRIKIKYRVRNKISGTTERPRMSVFRSNKQIYVQVIDDLSGRTLAAASSLGMEAMPKKEQAAKVGELIAKKAQEAGITTVVFDRNGYLYHGCYYHVPFIQILFYRLHMSCLAYQYFSNHIDNSCYKEQ